MVRISLCFIFAIIVITGNVSVAMVIRRNGDNPDHHHKNSKKYVIEVQDHQSAMKSANPIVDLEDSVRRGINDPLSDPRFVMNKINDDFFGSSQITENSLHSNELLAYQGKSNMLPMPFMNFNKNTFNRPFTPTDPLQQQADKNGLISRRPMQNFAAIQNIRMQKQPMHQLSFSHQQPLQNAMSSAVGDVHVTGNIAQNVAGGLSQGLPGGVAAFLSKDKLAPFASGVTLGNIRTGNTFDEKASSLPQIAGSRTRFIHQKLPSRIERFPTGQHNSYFHAPSPPSSKNNINPLTGLPEDLEDRTYGSVSSITSVSDEPSPSKQPDSITVETSEGSPEIETINKPQTQTSDQHQANYQDITKQQESSRQDPLREATTLESLHNDKSSSDDNFSSLKDYLDADNALRNSLAKDGIETIDPSKKLNTRATLPIKQYRFAQRLQTDTK